GGRVGRAWTWQGRGRGLVNGRAGGLRREDEDTGDYEKSATAHVCDAGPMRDLANPPHADRMLRAQSTRVVPSALSSIRTSQPPMTWRDVQDQ
ncbi:MAG: hypothetical protein ACREDM_04315, partial [Methylocella sp.]